MFEFSPMTLTIIREGLSAEETVMFHIPQLI